MKIQATLIGFLLLTGCMETQSADQSMMSSQNVADEYTPVRTNADHSKNIANLASLAFNDHDFSVRSIEDIQRVNEDGASATLICGTVEVVDIGLKNFYYQHLIGSEDGETILLFAGDDNCLTLFNGTNRNIQYSATKRLM